MTKEEFRALVFLLRQLYPRCGKYQDRNICNSWWLVVKNEDYTALRDAAAEFAKNNKYPPDIYDLFAGRQNNKGAVMGGGNTTKRNREWMKKYIARSEGDGHGDEL